ncbi:hypothetical protein ACFE04_027838 [Oxalis oulophora]
MVEAEAKILLAKQQASCDYCGTCIATLPKLRNHQSKICTSRKLQPARIGKEKDQTVTLHPDTEDMLSWDPGKNGVFNVKDGVTYLESNSPNLQQNRFNMIWQGEATSGRDVMIKTLKRSWLVDHIIPLAYT